MSAYLHPAKKCPQSKSWPFAEYTLLMASGGVAELERFRQALKLKAAWLHDSCGVKAYKLPPGLVEEAKKLGAELLTDREFMEKIRSIRGDL